MYRDDREALLHRLAVLEGQVIEVEHLRKRVAELEAELAVLRPPPPPPSPPPIARTGVLVLRKEGPGVNEFVTLDHDIIRVGRLKNAQLFLDDASLSRMHCVIERHDDGFDIIDLGSDGGTHVNDQPVSKARLKKGDVIRLAGFRLTVM